MKEIELFGFFKQLVKHIIAKVKYKISEKSGEIYVYKFNGNFVETINGNQGHKTNGYMGQVLRTLPLIQKNYNYRGTIINRPKLIINRDAHITSMATLDAEWVKQFRDVSLTKKGKYVFNPAGPNYRENGMILKNVIIMIKVII